MKDLKIRPPDVACPKTLKMSVVSAADSELCF
jgi:hypothetical protein